MIVYILKSALLLGVLYSCYYILLNKETFHRFNRSVLIGIMLISLILPALKTTTGNPTVVNTEISNLQSGIDSPMQGVTLKGVEVVAGQKRTMTWSEILSILYYTGVAISLLLTIIQIFSLFRYMKGGLRHTDSLGNTIILKPGQESPYSIFHFIVMSVDDYEHNRSSILTHEQEHIRLHHSYDLVLLEVVKTLQWFNPFVWFLASNLRTVHEYEADEAVINQGIDAKQYQQLLVIKAVGNRLQPLANNLRRGSLKKRIIMMYQKKSNRWMMLKALFVVPVAIFAISAFATPKVSSVKGKSSVALASFKEKVYDNVDVVPVYPGGQDKMSEYMMTSVKYPKAAQEQGVQGEVVVAFVVKEDGSISEVKAKKLSDYKATEGNSLGEMVVNAYAMKAASATDEATKEDLEKEKEGQLALIEEAERVVSAMPNWTPGQVKVKKGIMQNVRTRLVLAITFRLN